MATVKETLRSDLNINRKAKNELAVTTLGLVISEIQTQEKAGKTAVEFDDAATLKVITAEVKKRRDTAHTYAEAGQVDRAARENAEADLLAVYLPTPLTEAEVSEIVDAAIDFSNSPIFGIVMKTTMSLISARADKRTADGRTISSVVKARLGA